jgi:hypothetical protein
MNRTRRVEALSHVLPRGDIARVIPLGPVVVRCGRITSRETILSKHILGAAAGLAVMVFSLEIPERSPQNRRISMLLNA